MSRMSIILDVECIACNKSLQKINHDPGEVSRKMGRITSRRSRTPNWSLEEKQYLLDLIRERKELVVTKSNNGPNHSEEKDVAWNEILYQLVLKFGNKFSGFSIKKVKTQWQNMKRIAREEIILNGASLLKCTKQSQDVCNILESQNNADLKLEIERNENLHETTMQTDVEIKTESIDEDINQPNDNNLSCTESQQNNSVEVNSLESSASSNTMHTDIIENDIQEEVITIQDDDNIKKNVYTETDATCDNNTFNINTFHREFNAFLRYSATEKEIKIESLKEERQIVRAMRETAELNKIIAEQKLKHVLWIKKQEVATFNYMKKIDSQELKHSSILNKIDKLQFITKQHLIKNE